MKKSQSTFKAYCEICKKETKHIVVDHIDSYESIGMLGSDKIECQECRFSFWV